jgi:hypothetical protein
MNYTTAREEMIACAPHKIDDKLNAEFQINSGKVFDAVTLVMRETVAWTYVMPLAKKRDGHGPITALYRHYLGLNNINNQASAAENVLNMTTYTGEMHHWNFEKYPTLHKKQHGILEGLMEQPGIQRYRQRYQGLPSYGWHHNQ